MAGRKTKLTPERQEKILDCVRIGMSNRAAAQVAGISEKTLYNWIECGEKDTSGLFFDFWESLQAATVQFELSNCRIIHRSATEETRIVRQTIRYKSGQVVEWEAGGWKIQVCYDSDRDSPTFDKECYVAA